ncbi:hypothetical protein V5O48_006606 [Marasmius crinis-equi]|uniref:Uncharacterized protein n=1 Tax=Marasmius crinis-equi TaxID=585013 RepID=A0ABR3FJ07_9AGAR
MSRAVWRAMHVSMQAGDFRSAHLILNSVRCSQTPDSQNYPLRKADVPQIIEFKAPISTRLCSHSLLHGYLRLGLGQRAYRLVQQLLADGVRIHPKTLEAVVHGVLDNSKPSSMNGELYIRWKALLPTQTVLHLSPAVSSNPSIRCAIQILQAAREHNRQHSERMFSAVIKACLLHGELLAASLIFTAIIKACTLKETIPAYVSSHPESAASMPQVNSFESRLYRPHPNSGLMYSIVSSIMEIIGRDTKDSENGTFEVTFQAALQALANLACLLDLRQLPFGQVACLLRALYSCPKVDNQVWIRKHDGRADRFYRVPAYDYFHGVVERIARDPPRPPTRGKPSSHIRKDELPSAMPKLDMHSCNSLLHYSLRHRLSAKLSKGIMAYINRFYSPDTTTINILVASGRILRMPHLAENALTRLCWPSDEEKNSLPIPPAPIDARKANTQQFTDAIRQLSDARLEEFLRGPVNLLLQADKFSLSSYITYLVSTGRSELVSAALFELLPELTVIDHPSWGSADPEVVHPHCGETHEACLRRVVPYGPYFFVSLLNALRKAGQTGLAERVWMLAKQAEKASWAEEFKGDSEPWLLPVHAYTVMIQCYAQQAVRGAQSVTEREEGWNPQSQTRVRGWAKYVLSSGKRKRRQPPSSATVSVYSSMMTGAREVYNQLLELHAQDAPADTYQSARIPKPDARFFNAMLYMTTRHPRMVRRRRRTFPGHWGQHIRFARWLYAEVGTPRSHPNTHIQEVTMDMMKHGFPLPLGLQYLLVGRHPVTMARYKPSVVPIDNGPYAYPRLPTKSAPFTLPVGKTKGLPVRRKRTRFSEYGRTSRSV